ncbi:ABC transporter permease [Leptolyngbya sp. BC1307]|uniref:ABC transporter permease n=1 Tax=Leptolyngbya sp. BC1307 TaxID=2029589 RepID=UPI000EFB0645|nr:ABC transporter permease [Leptolyngbya sp. BC1307]
METRSWWQKLKNNSMARFGATVLIIFYIAVIFADFVAPYDPLAQQPNGSLLPPTQIYWRGADRWRGAEREFIGPHVYPTIQGPIDLDTGRQEIEVDYSRPAPIRLFVRGSEYRLFELSIPIITSLSFDGEITMREQDIFPGIPSDLHLFGTVGPASPNAIAADPTIGEATEGEDAPEAVSISPAYINLLGTDNAARDVLSRLIYGGRISLSIGLIGIAISFPLGLLVGGISGYFGGWIDSVLMRLVEVIMTIPSLYLLVALGVILPPELNSSERFLLIILIISFVGWAGLARVIRGEVLSIKERTFVQASRSMGGRSLHIITRHILPQTATYVIIAATLSIPSYIVAEAVLSLIGLGIQEPDPSWGNMLSAGTNASILVLNPWLVWPPAALIVITVLSFNLLGDGLRDALDPRSLQER